MASKRACVDLPELRTNQASAAARAVNIHQGLARLLLREARRQAGRNDLGGAWRVSGKRRSKGQRSEVMQRGATPGKSCPFKHAVWHYRMAGRPQPDEKR